MKHAYLLSLALLVLAVQQLKAQNSNLNIRDRSITVAAPFLLVPSDAKASGMGDIGVSSPPDTYAQQWNPAKYAFAKQQQGIGLSYTPYLRKLTNDINVGQLNYYNRFNERSAFAASMRYFSLGKVDGRQTPNDPGLDLNPNQFALDLSYALQLSKHFSMGVTGRYIRSDLKLQTSFDDASTANSFSVDVSGIYNSPIVQYNQFDGRWLAGFNIANISPKLSYGADGEESFLPTNLSLGAGYEFMVDQDNVLGAYTQFNKLLVPTPSDSNNDGKINREDDYYTMSAIEGIFTSFTDAPGGLREELKEITWALGAEYRYQDQFSIRTGYFHESPDKGYRQYITLGAGFKYDFAEFNLSYLFS